VVGASDTVCAAGAAASAEGTGVDAELRAAGVVRAESAAGLCAAGTAASDGGTGVGAELRAAGVVDTECDAELRAAGVVGIE
jgi:hypothetical protein